MRRKNMSESQGQTPAQKMIGDFLPKMVSLTDDVLFGDIWERAELSMQTAERQARQHHYPKIALHVAQGNKQALDLYAHLHYVVTQQTFLYQRPYVRMVKTLDNWEPGNNATESTERTQRHAQ